MNSKVLIAALATAVASFLLGWLVFGMALKGYYAANTGDVAQTLMKDPPNMLGLVIGNLFWGGFFAWALSRMGVTSAGAGWMAGLIIGAFVAASMDMFRLSTSEWFTNKTVVIVDILVKGVMSAILGGVAGAMLGMGGPKAAA